MGSWDLEQKAERLSHSFQVTAVSRADLEAMGFDTSDISDSKMEWLASEMSDNEGFMNAYWESLSFAAEIVGVSRRIGENSYSDFKIEDQVKIVRDYSGEMPELIGQAGCIFAMSNDLIGVNINGEADPNILDGKTVEAWCFPSEIEFVEDEN